MVSRSLRTIIGVFGLISASTYVQAQEIYPVVDTAWMNNMALNSAMMDAAKGTSDIIGRRSSATQSKLQQEDLQFLSSESRRRENLTQFVEKTRAVDPAGAKQMQALFASVDVIDAVGAEMEKIGLKSDNLADAYAIWWVTAWYAVQGRESESTFKTMAAVRQQAANSILATGELESASDSTKQEMAEALIVQAAMVDGANDQARGDRNKTRTLSAAVNKGAKAMGLDLTSMTLTSEGFQPRRGSDAGDAIKAFEGAEPKTLAASLTTDAPPAAANDNSATYALLAAAGGAGLAAMFMAGRASGRKG